MKVFNASIANIKNAKGEFEPMAALRGLSSYELAVKNGFEGTEAEWMEMMLTDGWVGTCQNLDAKKANLTDVFTRGQTVSDSVKLNYGYAADVDVLPSSIFLKAAQRLVNLESNYLQIYIGEYTGSGGNTYNNPTVLSVGIKPLMVWVKQKGFRYDERGSHGPWVYGQSEGYSYTSGDNNYTVKLSWFDDRVEWYDSGQTSDAHQLNATNEVYEYVIIGIKIPEVSI